MLSSGYVGAYLQAAGRSVTLDEPGSEGGASVVVNGKQFNDFHLDCRHSKSTDVIGRLGSGAKRIEVRGRSPKLPNLEETIALEIYDAFPNVVTSSVTWRNTGRTDLALERVTVQNQRLNASKTDPGVPAYRMWSFQGSSEVWGKDEITQLSSKFDRTNPIQQLTFSAKGAGGAGGGIPVLAFWTLTRHTDKFEALHKTVLLQKILHLCSPGQRPRHRSSLICPHLYHRCIFCENQLNRSFQKMLWPAILFFAFQEEPWSY